MNINNDNFDLLLNVIEEKCEPAAYVKRIVPFMIECATLIEPRMSPKTLSMFNVIRSYADAQLTPAGEVRATMTKCWEDLKADHRDMRLDDPEVCAIRAMICILDAQLHSETNNFVDVLSFFTSLLNRLEPHNLEHEALLRKYFAACI